MPACDNRLLEVLFFNGGAAGGIHITQDTILGPDKVRVRVEARVEEGNCDTAPGEIRVGLDADRRSQELLFIACIHRKRCEQFRLERGQAASLNRSFHRTMDTLRASAIITLPAGITLA